ncbi:MAG: type III-A CRISPR-associated protein Csm2 [Candidatus Competibacteraceae bacterium]|nr:type III-A CRISPR-associated protein Csm2 [Candidatus Competibacteraceae bacterium]MBK8964201.1 type III-A CRISPR-associated protein Csm2 [Candidatus Competibacteraceae bacterium]
MPDHRHGNQRPANNAPYRDRRPSGGHYSDREEPTLATDKIVFDPLDAELFNKVAQQTAKTIAENGGFNKPSQIRKFYDELCLWEAKVNQVAAQADARFNECWPFILMLNAKAAYAKGRKLVDDNFVKLVSHSLNQVKSPRTLRLCKLFFEAFLGFYKELRPSDK